MGLLDIVGDIFGGEVDARASVPGPSANESRLDQLLADQVEQQNLLINALLPSMLASSGMQPVFDEEGKLKSVQPLETAESKRVQEAQKKFLDLTLTQLEGVVANAPQQQEIQDLLNKRTLAALKGELPEDPALLRQLGEEEEVLDETLRKNLGPGWATSEPALRAKMSFLGRKNEALSASRRGDLLTATQLGGQNLSSIASQVPAGLDVTERLRGTRLSELFQLPATFSTGLGNINPYLSTQLRGRLGLGQLGLDADKFNSQLNASSLFGLFGGGPFGIK